MNIAKRYLQKLEWSMGNGQCPECCGVPKGWRLTEPEDMGHKADCNLAAALRDLGDTPLMIGDLDGAEKKRIS